MYFKISFQILGMLHVLEGTYIFAKKKNDSLKRHALTTLWVV